MRKQRTLRLTDEHFIAKRIAVHGDKYDYSKSMFTAMHHKVIIICSKHGEFLQQPCKHILGQGCPRCLNNSATTVHATNKYLELFKRAHLDRYDYSKTICDKSHRYVIVTCKEHGDFYVTPRNHVNGIGCKLCLDSNTSVSNFINSANSIWSNAYDYSKLTTLEHKLTILCKKHNIEFYQTAKKHLRGLVSCKACKYENRSDYNAKLIERANSVHKNSYEYSKFDYINRKTKVIITCLKHGDFEESAIKHINGHGCKACKHDSSVTFSAMLKRFILMHGDKYDYSNVDYIDTSKKIKIICKNHGEFEQTPNNHAQGKGCKKCSSSVSKQEQQVREFIESLNINVIGNARKIVKHAELDVFATDYNIAVEYDGLYWHSDAKKIKTYHLDKTNSCLSKGIRLIHIFEDEWLFKKQIVCSRLRNIFGKTTDRIYARKCIVQEVTSSDAKAFLLENHIQGHTASHTRLGLYYDDKLVSLMTFCNLRKAIGSKHVENSHELLRYCNILDTTVIGGASKLLSAFIKMTKPSTIVSYSDRRWSIGNLYEKLGFTHMHNSVPNYFYIINGIRKHRYGFRKDLLVSAGYDKNMTEQEIMQSRGINRIYDCGSSKWVLTI